jgi:transposase
VARSILVIVWRLLADPTVRYHELGTDYYAAKTDKARQVRNHIRHLQALGFTVNTPSLN